MPDSPRSSTRSMSVIDLEAELRRRIDFPIVYTNAGSGLGGDGGGGRG